MKQLCFKFKAGIRGKKGKIWANPTGLNWRLNADLKVQNINTFPMLIKYLAANSRN
jgi:hypothetical protein